MPILLLIGEQEFLYNSKAAVERAKHVLTDSDIGLLSQCNHAIVSDQTELVGTRVLEFLNR